MALDDWGRAEEADAGRAKRLAGSYAVAFALVATVLVVGVVFGGQLKKTVLEEEVHVTFVPPEPFKAAPVPPPPPPPPPPPRAAPRAIVPGARAALGSRRDAPPKEIPKAPPAEGDPNAPRAEEAAGEGDPDGCVGCTGKGGAAPIAPEPAPPAPPPPAPPIVQIQEVSTPPVALAKAMPAYPDVARKQGIEAVIVVKFVIREDGRVETPEVLRGHPMFDDAVLAIVRTWTFQPATLDGKPVRMARIVKIPFRLKAS